MTGKVIYGWDSVNKKYVKIQTDTNGKLIIVS